MEHGLLNNLLQENVISMITSQQIEPVPAHCVENTVLTFGYFRALKPEPKPPGHCYCPVRIDVPSYASVDVDVS